MNTSLKNKTALVAGSTSGIGHATAIMMAGMGADIVLIARNRDKLNAVREALNGISSGNHKVLEADFSDSASLEEAIAAYFKDGGCADILVNNTGGPPGGPVHTAGKDAFRSAFEMHLICNHILATACIPSMRKRGYGRIINVISTSVKQPLPNLGVSNTVRGAVANWAKTLSNELGPFGITVNNVLPGATRTGRLSSIVENKAKKAEITPEQALKQMADAVPLKRVAEPEEVAAGICFLASPAASYINGINLPVDGGRTGTL